MQAGRQARIGKVLGYPKLDSQGAIFGALGIHQVPSSVLLQLHRSPWTHEFHLSISFISSSRYSTGLKVTDRLCGASRATWYILLLPSLPLLVSAKSGISFCTMQNFILNRLQQIHSQV